MIIPNVEGAISFLITNLEWRTI
uniref:Uncharacterized protein n=1 Tax=Arundo donax TaxID=35708 RepID=A0A0A9C6J6_ARUDO